MLALGIGFNNASMQSKPLSLHLFMFWFAFSINLTLAARGLEEPWNFRELLTESVGRVNFS